MAEFAPTLIEVVKLLLLPSTLFTFAFCVLTALRPAKPLSSPMSRPDTRCMMLQGH